MVGQLTDDPDFIYEYRNRVAFATYARQTLHERVDEDRQSIRSKMRKLGSILERLELFEGTSETPEITLAKRPRVFLAHGGQSANRDQLELFLWRDGLRPVIVEEMPSLGMGPDDKVDYYMRDGAFAVILAEAERPSSQDGKLYPRLNIVDEIARVRKVLASKFIVFLESGLNLPSNESGITWEGFESGGIALVFPALGRELAAHKIVGLDD